MRDDKTQIILDAGTPVEIFDSTGEVHIKTTALIGKASKQLMAEVSLETHRQGQFIADLAIKNGYIVYNPLLEIHYLILANIPEVVQGEKIATVTRMLECNSVLYAKRFEEDADDVGNITRSEKLIADAVRVYIQSGKFYVEQRNPGVSAEFEYRVFAPSIPLKILDTVCLLINGQEEEFKVQSLDYTTFPGVVIIDVITESRK